MADVPSSRLLNLPPEIRSNILLHYCEITKLQLLVSIRGDIASEGKFSYMETDLCQRMPLMAGTESGLARTCQQLRSEFIDQAVSCCSLVLDLPFWRRSREISATPNIRNTRLSKLVPVHIASRITQAKIEISTYPEIADYLFELANLTRWLPSLRTLEVAAEEMNVSRALRKSDWNMTDIVNSPSFNSSRDRHYEAQLHYFYGLIGRPEDREYRVKILSHGGLYDNGESEDLNFAIHITVEETSDGTLSITQEFSDDFIDIERRRKNGETVTLTTLELW